MSVHLTNKRKSYKELIDAEYIRHPTIGLIKILHLNKQEDGNYQYHTTKIENSDLIETGE